MSEMAFLKNYLSLTWWLWHKIGTLSREVLVS